MFLMVCVGQFYRSSLPKSCPSYQSLRHNKKGALTKTGTLRNIVNTLDDGANGVMMLTMD